MLVCVLPHTDAPSVMAPSKLRRSQSARARTCGTSSSATHSHSLYGTTSCGIFSSTRRRRRRRREEERREGEGEGEVALTTVRSQDAGLRRRQASIAGISLLVSSSALSLLPISRAAAQEEVIRRAYFGAGDAEQLAPFFRDLIYRGVKTATTGVADGKVEVVCVEYDQNRTPFSDLLRVYFRRVNAADGDGQFKERGEKYAPVIYAPDSEALMEAKKVVQLLEESGIYGGEKKQVVPLPVKLLDGLPGRFEANANQKLLKGDPLKKALKKSGRYVSS